MIKLSSVASILFGITWLVPSRLFTRRDVDAP